MFHKLLLWQLRHRWAGLLLSLAICGLGLSRGLDLPLKLSLANLLPESRQSVRDLNDVSAEVGGVGYLIILIGPTKAPEKFLKPLALTIKNIPDVKYSFYEREEYSLRAQALYLLPRTDFDEVLSAARTLIRGGKKSMIDLGLDDEVDQSDAQKEARERILKLQSANPKRNDHFFLSSNGRYAMFLVKPTFDSEDLGRSTEFIQAVRNNIDQNFPNKFPYQLVGRYVNKVHDTKQMKGDIAFTSLVSSLGIFIILVIGLGAFRAAALTISMVTIAMAWTLGFAQLFVGQINILTGFLLAILGGLGVEYGIHLIRRYYQERAQGRPHENALLTTYKSMGRALGSAALTSSASFLILSFSDFRGFSELGKIAGVGILAIYFVYMLCFPFIGSYLREKPRFNAALEIFGTYPFNRKWRLPVLVLATACIYGLYNAEFEYDFQRMHQLSESTVRTQNFVDKLFGRSFNPAALLATDKTQAAAVEAWLKDPSRKLIIQEAVSLVQLIPTDMSERWDKIKNLGSKLKGLSDAEIFEKTGVSATDIRSWLNRSPYTQNDLPPQLRDAFGNSGNIVLAYSALDLDHVKGLRSFSNLLQEARDTFPGLKIGSDVRIFTEILDHITKDGLIILAIFLIGAFINFWGDFGNWRDALALELQLITGLLLLVALMGLFDQRFSILNVAMIPAVLAAGIDIGVHVRHRQREGHAPLASARFVAQAVQLSALTTIIGFGSLFFADAGMLRGIAWISVLGQISMYLVCMVIWPIFQRQSAK